MIFSTSRHHSHRKHQYQQQQQQQQQLSIITYRFTTTTSIILVILLPVLVSSLQHHHHGTIVCEAFRITTITNQYIINQQQLHRKRRSRSSLFKLYEATTTTTLVNDNKNRPSSNHIFLNYLSTSTTTNRMIVIEYCIGCKWNLRAFWMVQELLYRNNNNHECIDTKSSPSSLGVTLVPSSNPGTYRITQFTNYDNVTSQEQQRIVVPDVLWDRTIDGGFPEIEELQQRIVAHQCRNDTLDQITEQTDIVHDNRSFDTNHYPNIISILYSTGSNSDNEINVGMDTTFLFRAAYVAQEIVSTFQNEIYAISILPHIYNTNENNTSNIPLFTVQLNNNSTIYEYNISQKVPFLPIKELKQRIRDHINPTMDLGHSDVSKAILPVLDTSSMENNTTTIDNNNSILITNLEDDDNDNDDDTEAEEARQYFGVA
jgi:selenoprotein W-related protein